MSGPDQQGGNPTGKLVRIDLDEQSMARRSSEVDRERAVAIFDDALLASTIGMRPPAEA